jgi:hypothetical protein
VLVRKIYRINKACSTRSMEEVSRRCDECRNFYVILDKDHKQPLLESCALQLKKLNNQVCRLDEIHRRLHKLAVHLAEEVKIPQRVQESGVSISDIDVEAYQEHVDGYRAESESLCRALLSHGQKAQLAMQYVQEALEGTVEACISELTCATQQLTNDLNFNTLIVESFGRLETRKGCLQELTGLVFSHPIPLAESKASPAPDANVMDLVDSQSQDQEILASSAAINSSIRSSNRISHSARKRVRGNDNDAATDEELIKLGLLDASHGHSSDQHSHLSDQSSLSHVHHTRCTRSRGSYTDKADVKREHEAEQLRSQPLNMPKTHVARAYEATQEQEDDRLGTREHDGRSGATAKLSSRCSGPYVEPETAAVVLPRDENSDQGDEEELNDEGAETETESEPGSGWIEYPIAGTHRSRVPVKPQPSKEPIGFLPSHWNDARERQQISSYSALQTAKPPRVPVNLSSSAIESAARPVDCPLLHSSEKNSDKHSSETSYNRRDAHKTLDSLQYVDQLVSATLNTKSQLEQNFETEPSSHGTSHAWANPLQARTASEDAIEEEQLTQAQDDGSAAGRVVDLT